LTSSQEAFCGKYLSKRLSTTSWTDSAAATEMMAKKTVAFMIVKRYERYQLLEAM